MKEEARFAEQLAQDLPPDDLRHVLAVFAADLARLTETLVALAALGEAESFRRSAHALAGAAGAVGATALEQACRAAMAGLVAPGASLTAQLAAIRDAAVATRVEMADFLAGMDQPDG